MQNSFLKIHKYRILSKLQNFSASSEIITSGINGSAQEQRYISAQYCTDCSSKVNMSSQLADFVREQIKKERVVIFSKTYCPYCVMAKKQFDLIHYPYHCIELDERNDGNEIQDILLELTGARTVPRVFIDGKCIGGGTDAKKMNDDGTLEKILKS